MAEETLSEKALARKEPVELSFKHRGKEGLRFVYDIFQEQHFLEPGQEKKITVMQADADRYIAASEDGTGDLEIGGSPKREADEEEPKQLTRAEIDELERKNLEDARQASVSKTPSTPGKASAATRDDKKSRSDLEAMNKDDLADYAEGNDISGVSLAQTKAEMIDTIMKAQRK